MSLCKHYSILGQAPSASIARTFTIPHPITMPKSGARKNIKIFVVVKRFIRVAIVDPPRSGFCIVRLRLINAAIIAPAAPIKAAIIWMTDSTLTALSPFHS